MTIEKFTPELISRIQQEEKAKGSSHATVNRKTEVICAILNFSAKQRRIPFNPTIGFRKLRQQKAEIAFLNPAEASSFLSFMNSKYPPGSQKRWVYVV